jgi:hypothetical protein
MPAFASVRPPLTPALAQGFVSLPTDPPFRTGFPGYAVVSVWVNRGAIRENRLGEPVTVIPVLLSWFLNPFRAGHEDSVAGFPRRRSALAMHPRTVSATYLDAIACRHIAVCHAVR